MGAIRTLYTDLALRADKAVKGLKLYDRLWKQVAKSVETSATAIEKAADRSAAAMARISEGAALLRAGAGAGAGSSPRASSPRAPSTRTAKPAKDPLDAAIKAANVAESRRAGLAAGTTAINDATAALGKHASKMDVAKAKIQDFTAQVERNRREVAELKRRTVEAGDADGTLAARMQGLSVATGKAQIELSKAKRELTALNGGLINTIKSTITAKVTITALGQAAGNALTGAVSGGVNAIKGAFVESATSAIKFESALADVAKVVDGLKTPTGEITAEYTKMEAKILDLSKTIAGPGAEGFAKIYAAAGEAGIAKQDLDQFAESAAKVSVAFGVTAEEAGSGMAKMRSGLGLAQDEVESLAGTMNYLSNNMAVTAAQAMEVVLKTGGVGKAANVSGQEVAGLGAAMIASGAASDVASTATKNYILALSAGDKATKDQRIAFKKLGMDAEDVARRFTGTAQERLAVQQELLTSIDKLSKKSGAAGVSALSGLFGRESVGAISGITGDVDKFTKAMTMATDATAAASSVQNEYNVRSKTTENAVALLKANIEALAIKFGQALLPYINKVVAFLTSPEGQDWGAKAVDRAVGFVTGLADAVAALAGFFSGLIDTIGGAGTAVAGLGLMVASLAGPWGIAAAAATVAIGTMISGMAKLTAMIPGTKELVSGFFSPIQDAEKRKRDEAERERDIDEGLNKPSGPTFGYGPVPMAAPPPGMTSDEVSAKTAAGDKQARFDALSAKVRAGHKLKPSEATEYTRLSKDLDEAKASKAKKGRTHKQTKMDRQLAAIDPSVRGILTRGGEEDAGGDSMVAKNALDKAVFGKATHAKPGRGGIDGLGGVGPGPNITNHYTTNNVTTTVTMPIDARSTGSVPANIASAAQSAGTQVAGVTFTGISKVLASKNAGGAMRPA